MLKEMICIVCPNGCRLSVDTETHAVTGNTCKRGLDFAIEELTAPKRTISSTVATVFEDFPVLPVRVSKEIPKEMIFPVMAEINEVRVEERLKIGDIIIENVLGTGADIIAIQNM